MLIVVVIPIKRPSIHANNRKKKNKNIHMAYLNE
jgi:hypothetical protein